MMYRFRSVENLLDRYHELENQEIYFASLSELNDPMEGKMIVFWQGDGIVWRNFFIHYLRNLEMIVSHISLKETSIDKLVKHMPIWIDTKKYPTDSFKKTFTEIASRFFQNKSIDDFIRVVSSPPKRIEQAELESILMLVHRLALRTILDVMREQGYDMFDNYEFLGQNDENAQQFVKALERSWSLGHTKEQLDLIFEAMYHTSYELGLISSYNRRNHPLSDVVAFLVIDFPSHYLERIKELVYPNFYVACFMKEVTNAKSWGHYGDSHRGVCLVFKEHTDELKTYLSLFYPNTEEYKHGIREMKYPYAQVAYQDEFADVDFFRSLFRFSMQILRSNWYQSENGSVSQCNDIFDGDFEGKRLAYWDKLTRIMATKTTDWASENEYRITLTDSFYDLTDRENRKLIYKFDDLEGLIFGMNTPVKDKNRIMEVVLAKCAESGREDFNFYQASYSVRERKMKINRLSLLCQHEIPATPGFRVDIKRGAQEIY